MGVVLGGPKKPEKDERPAFYVHKNLYMYLEVTPEGVTVEGKTPDGKHLFNKPFPTSGDAMAYIEAHRKEYSNGDEGERDSEAS